MPCDSAHLPLIELSCVCKRFEHPYLVFKTDMNKFALLLHNPCQLDEQHL